jgi:hypothetical protein
VMKRKCSRDQFIDWYGIKTIGTDIILLKS